MNKGIAESAVELGTIGFIGAGQLGEPMVRRLVGAQHNVLVYARRQEVRSRLAELGVILAASPGELGACSDVLISSLFSDAQISQTALGADGFITTMRSGAVFVSHTTGDVAILNDLAERSAAGVSIVDAPVSGTAEHIAEGRLTVLIGGEPEALQRVIPILVAYADPIVATGALGSALRIKLLNNVLFAANAQLVAEAAQVGERLGVDPGALVRAILVCSGASSAASHVDRTGSLEAFADLATPFLRKDVEVAIAVADNAGTDLGLLGVVARDGPLRLAGG